MDLRETLVRELQRRQSANPRYSLRAFARQLGIDHSTLSQVLRGQRRLSARAVEALAAKLGLDPADCRALAAAQSDEDVLAALRDPRFRADSRWIARRTGLTLDSVNVSLQRLLHRRAITMVTRERWLCER